MLKLYVMRGPNRGQSFELKGDITYVGRSPDNDIPMNDRSVSRKHLKILRKGNRYLVEDLESKNRTFVNGKPIDSGREFEVKEGTPIAIGETVICLGKALLSDEMDTEDLSVLDSIDLSKELRENGRAPQDRTMTLQKNMDLIYKVSSVLMESVNISEALEKILNYILDLLKRIDRGFFVVVDNQTGEVSELISILKDSSDETLKIYSRSIVDRVIREGKAVTMFNTLIEDEADLSESMKLMKIKSVMCVPLISKSQIRGAIYVDSISKPYGFRREDLSLLTALSSPAAIAIENAFLYAKESSET